jgi:H+/Cl- antiporter ClcA
MKKLTVILGSSILTGAIIAVIYFIFHNLVTELQDYIWFDVAGTDEHKLMAIPLAIAGALLLAFTLKVFKDRGHQDIGHAIKDYTAHGKQINVRWLIQVFIIGLVSLVGGASLGPEAILLPISYGVGYLIAKKAKLDQPELFGMMGVIALLASFFNAYAAALLPLSFIAYNRSKNTKKTILAIILGFVATFSALAVLKILHEREGYVTIEPLGTIATSPVLLLTALVMAAFATLIPLLLDKIVIPLKKVFMLFDKNWVIGSIIAGLGVGVIYALIGPIGFFSGQFGMSQLLQLNSEYTSLQLAGLALGKLIVTAWCIATIYRGGPIFPQLLVGMSIVLLFSGASPNSDWLATLLIASFFGIFTGALGSLIISTAFVVSLFGVSAWPIIIAAAVGSQLVKIVFKDKFAAKAAL